jgi:hypothetical protein
MSPSEAILKESMIGDMTMDQLSVEQWPIGRIADYVSADSDAKKLIEIPKFQRGVVWGAVKIEKLVDSLFSSYPIGSLLAFNAGASGAKVRYQLVDGLQRANALARFSQEPLTYCAPDHIFSVEFLEQTSNALGLDNEDDFSKIRNMFSLWMKQVKSPESQSYMAHELRSYLCQEHEDKKVNLDVIGKEIEKAVYDAKGKIQRILGATVPVLIYEGSEENIPEIFERINSQGMPLSKYDILASSWVNTTTKIDNQRVKEEILDKYLSWQEQGFEVSEDLLQNVENGNLHEYLVGFSKVLSKDFPVLFGPQESEDIAFQIFTVASRLPVSRMRELSKWMNRNSEGVITPSSMEKAVYSACGKISSTLKGYTSLRGNKNIDDERIAHSQNQIISLITSLVVNCYDSKTGELADQPKSHRFLQYLPAHYLLDIMRKAWKGSGDSRLYARTWSPIELDAHNRPTKPDDYYLRKISVEEFASAFKDWDRELLTKRQVARPNLQKDVLLVLQFLYSGIVSVLHDNNEKYEIEHVYPVKFCSDLIEESEDSSGWPISAVGNLMLLPKTINRIKGSKLLGPEIEKLLESGDVSQDEVSRIAKYLIEPSIQEITVESVKDKDAFIDFCQKRSSAILNQIQINLKLSEL